jgi:Sigma-70, region 4
MGSRTSTLHSGTTSEPHPGPNEPIAIRDAASRLITHASPEESAAVLLKDVFDFTLEEIAVSLTTTIGAVKAVLYRGRAQLDEKYTQRMAGSRTPSKELLNRFSAAFKCALARRRERVAGQHNLRGALASAASAVRKI